jgi:hypothetical protein
MLCEGNLHGDKRRVANLEGEMLHFVQHDKGGGGNVECRVANLECCVLSCDRLTELIHC